MCVRACVCVCPYITLDFCFVHYSAAKDRSISPLVMGSSGPVNLKFSPILEVS